MIGKAANVRRFVVSLVVGGRVGWTRASAASTNCSVWNMSTFQEKYRSTSAEPRLVIDFTRSQPLHAVDGLFDRACDGDQHLVDRRDAVIDADDDAREVGRREDRNGDRERQVHSRRRERQNDEDDRLAVARSPVLALGSSFFRAIENAHFWLPPAAPGCCTFTFAPSCSPTPPDTTTRSPAWHALDDLNFIAVAHANLHLVLMGDGIRPDHHHRSPAGFRWKKGGAGNQDRIGDGARVNRHVDRSAGTEPLAGIRRLNPHLDGRALRIHGRTYDSHFAFHWL